MTDKMDRALDMVEKAGGKIDGYINSLGDGIAAVGAKLTELANQYGGDLLDLALNIYRVKALGELLIGLVLLSLTIVLWVFYVKIWWQKVTVNFNAPSGERGAARGFVAVALAIFSLFTGSIAFTQLTNIWYWVGVFEPKLYVAYLILEKVIK